MSVHAFKTLPRPLRGEVWQREGETGPQPVLVVSSDELNQSRAGLVLVLPIATTASNIPSHIRTRPPEGGLHQPGFIQCEWLHAMHRAQLVQTMGALHPATFAQVEDCLKLLLNF